MELQDAVELIRPVLSSEQGKKVWADLGCGEGLFTRALATILQAGSMIHAVDKSAQVIEPSFNGNALTFQQLDFNEHVLPFSELDGILMANSIHFVKEKGTLLARLKKILKKQGQLLIIEYELAKGNHWIPYPIPYRSLEVQLAENGFTNIRRVSERKSMYGGRTMYTCAAIKI